MAEDDGGSRGAVAGMRELEARVKTCQLCRLAKTRTRAVPGEGDYGAEVMFIGEGPGYHEDKQGRPFIGQAGQFLNELLGLAGLSRETSYITNVVKCRPPNNRDPEPDEMGACAPYLERQIALINPRIIVTLGRFSMSKFFPGERISQIHGTARMVGGRMCVAMYHPAAGLHQASLADVIRSDFRKLPIFIQQARKMLAPPVEVVEQRVVEAEAERDAVVHDPETAVVLEEEEVGRVKEASTVYNVSEEVTPAAVEMEEATEKSSPAPSKAAARSKKPAPRKEEYKQTSFLDM
jgi:DNA polymerase